MKRYLRCRWAINEDTVRRLERYGRHSGISVQRIVDDVLTEYFANRRDIQPSVGRRRLPRR